MRIDRKLKLPSIVVHSTKRTKVAQEDQHDKIWRNNSRANVRPSGEKTNLIKLKNPKSEVRFPIYAKRLMRVR